MNYYNEFDPGAAAWLEELITAGLIPQGKVDTRSIADVTAADLHGFTQCHFFAGIGGWSRALQLAGWPADKPVWTGSCPCQAFSSAGKGGGTSDHRDLWPVFANLIRECKPEYVFGEQVEAAIRFGWLDRVYRDLEEETYAVGSCVLGAHSVNAPHIRKRLYWGARGLADTAGSRPHRGRAHGTGFAPIMPWQRCSVGRLADNDIGRCQELRQSITVQPDEQRQTEGAEPELHGDSNPWADAIWWPADNNAGSRLADTESAGSMRAAGAIHGTPERPSGDDMHERFGTGEVSGGMADTELHGYTATEDGRSISKEQTEGRLLKPARGCNVDWRDAVWWPCRDGKYRRVPVQPTIKSILEFASDGIQCILDSSRNEVLFKIKEKVICYAEKTETRPGEVLFALWKTLAQVSLWKKTGGYDPFQKEILLLFALCQLARDKVYGFNDTTPHLEQIYPGTLCVMWEVRQSQVEAACPSHQSRLDRSPHGELDNFMCFLSSCDTSEEAETVQGLRGTIQATSDVSETLSEICEIWESANDSKTQKRDCASIRSCVSFIDGLRMFPLAPKQEGAAVLLKGYGNAIVPQVAAEFVRAFIG